VSLGVDVTAGAGAGVSGAGVSGNRRPLFEFAMITAALGWLRAVFDGKLFAMVEVMEKACRRSSTDKINLPPESKLSSSSVISVYAGTKLATNLVGLGGAGVGLLVQSLHLQCFVQCPLPELH
jgi:hypothetical protein